MKNEAALSEDNTIALEAAQWIARRMGDEPFDEARFKAWLAGDPRRKAIFETMWQRIMGPHMDAALSRYVERRRSRRAALTTGATAAVAVLIGSQALPSVERLLTQPQVYAVADGALRTVKLADGTQLTLAGGATVEVRYTRHGREIDLTQGTVFADVAHDENRPFRIEASDGQITVLGTRFEVSTKPSSVRVTVESGTVRFGRNSWFGTPIDLTAAQAAILDKGQVRRVDDVNRDRIARWRSEWIEYHDARLGQIIADLESVSPLPVKIASEGLADLRVSGRLRLVDPMRQIQNLSIIHGFEVDVRHDAIVLQAD